MFCAGWAGAADGDKRLSHKPGLVVGIAKFAIPTVSLASLWVYIRRIDGTKTNWIFILCGK